MTLHWQIACHEQVTIVTSAHDDHCQEEIHKSRATEIQHKLVTLCKKGKGLFEKQTIKQALIHQSKIQILKGVQVTR